MTRWWKAGTPWRCRFNVKDEFSSLFDGFLPSSENWEVVSQRSFFFIFFIAACYAQSIKLSHKPMSLSQYHYSLANSFKNHQFE